MTPEKPRRLGRGLEALLGGAAGPTADATVPSPDTPLRDIAIAAIRPNRYQPRRKFRQEEIADLQASLTANGLLQPITVRPDGDGYELIAGERRLRAATALGWTEIAAIVRPIDDQAALTLALVENLQRTDLNPIEEAEGYARLAAEFNLTQQAIARAVGKDRSTVANMLRLLMLPDKVRALLRDGEITTGHARAILGLPTEQAQSALAFEVVANGLTVRDVEQRVQNVTEPRQRSKRGSNATPPEPSTRDPHVRAIEDRLRAYLQTDVRVDLRGPQDGDLVIRFYSTDDLDRLLERILGPQIERHEE
jgi:ParB family transcriptional regulator, chromosome partitioning protein